MRPRLAVTHVRNWLRDVHQISLTRHVRPRLGRRYSLPTHFRAAVLDCCKILVLIPSFISFWKAKSQSITSFASGFRLAKFLQLHRRRFEIFASTTMLELEERRFSIGYALAPKKVHSFIQPSLIEHTKSQGIDLIPVDPIKPLIEQGPFDCLIHKLYDQDWKQQLIQFSLRNPNIPIMDHPDSIERLRNRISMLEVVSELKIPPHDQTLAIPKQVVIENSESLSDPINAIRGLNFPMIAKTLVADGSATSHKMFLVFNGDGLKGLATPIVLQEFVNHGGVVFKVYVVGEFVKCVKRRSLPDISPKKLGTLGGLLSFSQISNLTNYQEQGQDSDLDRRVEEAELPPLSFVEDVASGLRQAMKLNLFNFDMIRDTNDGNRYVVIDINYFPGYAKMPSYEIVLTDFFRQIVHKKQSGQKEDDKDLS